MPIPTPMSQQGPVLVAKNLGYCDAHGLLHSIHGRALEGSGLLQDWTVCAMQNLIVGYLSGGNLCCQTSAQQARGPLTHV
jgi:hypothetical protein